jgi:hypothetical protein
VLLLRGVPPMKSARDMLGAIVDDLDMLRDVDYALPKGISEGTVECVKRLAADRRALIRLLDELEVKPDRLGRYGGEDRTWNAWPGKPIEALRAHLGLAKDPGDGYVNERWSEREARVAQENHERSAAYAQEMAEAWMNECEQRRKAGL